ncbi:MAG: carboxymuconolactone decarboxylase family protein [Nitrospinaceae bacterium]
MPTAPENQDTVFKEAEALFGFLPNVIKEMAKSPVPAKLYLKAQEFLAEGVLTPREQQAVQLAVAVRNECSYCTAAHRTGGKMVGIEDKDLRIIQEEKVPEDKDLVPCVDAARLVMDKKGWLTPSDLHDLEAKGIDRAKLYEIVVLIALKTITNYINHIAQTEIDGPLRG